MQHSLVLGLDGRGMAKDQDCKLLLSAVTVFLEGGWFHSVPSATNSRYTLGDCSSFGKTTIPFLTSFRRTLFSANDADCPAEHTGTPIRLRSMDRMVVVVNWPSESGPIRIESPVWIAPNILG